MFNDKPLCLLVNDDYFPQELAEKLLSECLFNGDYDDFIVELFREEAVQSKRDFRNGFCDAYAIPMDMLSEVVAGFACKVKFDDSFSKDEAFFTADIVGEKIVVKSHKFSEIVTKYHDEIAEWAADDLPRCSTMSCGWRRKNGEPTTKKKFFQESLKSLSGNALPRCETSKRTKKNLFPIVANWFFFVCCY